jgi:hypothetical protein
MIVAARTGHSADPTTASHTTVPEHPVMAPCANIGKVGAGLRMTCRNVVVIWACADRVLGWQLQSSGVESGLITWPPYCS